MRGARHIALSFFICALAWGGFPSVSYAAASVVITENTNFSPGEYYFESLTITSSSTLTLLGNPMATTSFKGVIIHTENLTIDSGSRISADSKGYGRNQGPGASPLYYAGASYGGKGYANTATSTYGSALEPVELGSGGNSPGGGAMQLLVSGTFTNNGTVSANGGTSGSGGSILVSTGAFAGKGSFKALGGNRWVGGYYKHGGGGGRIMIRYATSSFTGTLDVSGGCSSDYVKLCGENGTAGLIDTTTNALVLPHAWRFQENDSPFSFAIIVVAKGNVINEPGVSISADYLALDAQGSVSFGDGVHLKVPLVTLAGASTFSLSGAADVIINDMTISGGSKVTTKLGKALTLSLANLTISSGSFVDVSAKGYPSMEGPGAPPIDANSMGASYGGKGYGNTATSTYGNADNPTDFGSGGFGAGGGALALTISGTLTNNGAVMANGQWSGSGGSILVHAREIVGSGSFSANGAAKTSSSFLGPGGGGRIALYTDTATPGFSGKVEAKGACNTMSGYYLYCGEDGTIVIKETGPKVSNVLFLPGIEASRLYRPDYSGGTDQLWEPNIENDVKDLFLTAEGKSIRNDVYTKDVLDEKNVLPVGQGNIYKSFIAQMDALKATSIITDWKAVPYDWRLSFDDMLDNGHELSGGRIYYAGDLAATSSPYIIQELRRLAKTSKTGKVTIVAHSNGGLVTKALTEKLGSEAQALIDKIVFVAVPQVGTPQAIGAILHGYDQGLPFDFLPLILTLETARSLAENMPSAYNLLPSANYFTQVADPVVTFDDSDILAEFRARYGSTIHDGARLSDFITDTRRLASSSPSDLRYPSVGNAALLTRAEAAHATLDSWTPPQGVSLYEIAGWGEDTLVGIKYREGKKASCSNPWDIRTCSIKSAITYDPVEVIDGDGTVVVPSALYGTSAISKYWVNLKDYDSPTRIERKHADILEIPELRMLMQNILTNATSTASLPFITNSTPPTDSTKRLRFLLHSPLDLSATDTLGNIVNAATSTIPGSHFKRYGEVQVLSVPEGTPLTLTLDGYAQGSFTLDMQEIDGNNTIAASSSFSGIPSTASTKAEVTFTDGTLQNASPLLLDYDGNGTTDLSFVPKIGEEVVFDITPPEATLVFDPVSQGLKIIGTDDLSNTTVSTTATSSVITDAAGNTLQVLFKKFKQEGRELKVELQELRYNGISAAEIPEAVVHYEWSTDKTGKLKEFQEKVSVGSLKVSGHFDAKKNTTKIGKEAHSGLVIIGIRTEKGSIKISY